MAARRRVKASSIFFFANLSPALVLSMWVDGAKQGKRRRVQDLLFQIVLSLMTLFAIASIATAEEQSETSQSLSASEAIELASQLTGDRIPSIVGSVAHASDTGPPANSVNAQSSDAYTNTPNPHSDTTATCLYTDEYCKCKRIAPTSDQLLSCLKFVANDDETGRSLCMPVTCPESHSYICDCQGDELCENKSSTHEPSWTLDFDQQAGGNLDAEKTYNCHKRQLSIVTKVEANATQEGERPSHVVAELTRTKTVAFNQTHCSCSPRIAVAPHGTCLTIFQKMDEEDAPNASHSSTDMCMKRDCDIKADEMVCDFMAGLSLCERTLVLVTSYQTIPEGPVLPQVVREEGETEQPEWPSNIVPCQLESGASEKLRCVSSCL